MEENEGLRGFNFRSVCNADFILPLQPVFEFRYFLQANLKFNIKSVK